MGKKPDDPQDLTDEMDADINQKAQVANLCRTPEHCFYTMGKAFVSASSVNPSISAGDRLSASVSTDVPLNGEKPTYTVNGDITIVHFPGGGTAEIHGEVNRVPTGNVEKSVSIKTEYTGILKKLNRVDDGKIRLFGVDKDIGPLKVGVDVNLDPKKFIWPVTPLYQHVGH